MNDGMLWESLWKRGEMMEKQERMTRNAIKRTRVGINISAELADVLQAEQERWRVRNALMSRPSYTKLIETMWEAYQEKNSSSDATLTS
jgi:hypothetical protein